MKARLILDVLSTLKELRRHEHWSRAQIEAYQSLELERLRNHVYAHSSFYRRFHEGLETRPLAELPVLSKAMLMDNFDALVTDPRVRLDAVRAHMARFDAGAPYLDSYRIVATSGSTGHPGLFLFDGREWDMVLASFARAHEWAGQKVSIMHRMKMASVASTHPWHMSTQVAATLDSRWMPALRLSASEPLEEIVRQLNAFRPDMLVAFASMARILATEQLAGRLAITPHLIFTSSEVLTPETRRQVEAAFGHPPFNQYAATESGGLAAECTYHQGMHLMEDLAIVEVVDRDNRPVPPGVFGNKLLITVLFNRTQPLIRYELSDSVRLAIKPCPCGRGFTLIDAIQGREEDVLWLPGAAGGEVAVQPMVFDAVMDTLPVSGWQVVQKEDGGLEVLLSGAENVDEEGLHTRLLAELQNQGARVPAIRIERVAAIPKSASGKAPLIRSEGIGPSSRQPATDMRRVNDLPR